MAQIMKDNGLLSAGGLVERAEMRQAVRLLELPPDAVTEAAVRTFLPEDLELPEGAGTPGPRVLGFA